MLGDHHLVGKSVPYAQSVTVPTAIRHPAYLGRRSCSSPVELIDLTATILDVAGIDPSVALSKPWPVFDDRIPCRSLMPIVRGESEAVRDYAFSEHVGWQMLLDDRYKYVRYPAASLDEPAREALFDTVADPDEQSGRVGGAEHAEALKRLRDFLSRAVDTTPAAQLRWAPTMRDPAEKTLC